MTTQTPPNNEHLGVYSNEEMTITLHSSQANKLMDGRKGDLDAAETSLKYGQAGLLSFAKSARILQERCKTDDPDPFALACLILIDKEIESTKIRFSNINQEMDNLISTLPKNIKIKYVSSTNPIEVTLNFKSPYAYALAYLISEYDELAIKAATLKRFGLISAKEFGGKYTFNLATPIRKIFKLPNAFPNTKQIGMSEFINNSDKRHALEELYGKVDEAIISDKVRPNF